jgi:hypothetical protein
MEQCLPSIKSRPLKREGASMSSELVMVYLAGSATMLVWALVWLMV